MFPVPFLDSIFSFKDLFPFTGEWFQNHNLGDKCAHCLSLNSDSNSEKPVFNHSTSTQWSNTCIARMTTLYSCKTQLYQPEHNAYVLQFNLLLVLHILGFWGQNFFLQRFIIQVDSAGTIMGREALQNLNVITFAFFFLVWKIYYGRCLSYNCCYCHS